MQGHLRFSPDLPTRHTGVALAPAHKSKPPTLLMHQEAAQRNVEGPPPGRPTLHLVLCGLLPSCRVQTHHSCKDHSQCGLSASLSGLLSLLSLGVIGVILGSTAVTK